MNKENMKIVDFEKYCKKCKYKDLSEEDDPCWGCLDMPARENSHKPEFFKEKD